MRSRIFLAALLLVQFASPCQGDDQAYIPEKWKGVILHAPMPRIPPATRTTDSFGTGIYRLVINQKTGDVDEVKVLKSTGRNPMDAEAVWTFFKWKFRPGTLKHVDVPVYFNRYVRVELRKAGSK